MPNLSYMIFIEKISVFPIKGMQGFHPKSAKLTGKGLEYDRRFMLVGDTGQGLTQRECPKMTQFDALIEHNNLIIRLRQTSSSITIPIPTLAKKQPTRMVQIWSSRVRAELVSAQVDTWLSDHLNQKVSLVYMPERCRRSVPPHYAGPGQTVSFADAYPYLITTEASLAELNSKLPESVPMNRFRPNIILGGDIKPFEEDTWSDIRIGDVAMRCVKPCARCIVITTDQETGSRGKEPLSTLAKFRKNGNKVLFGQNAVLIEPSKPGQVIRVGDVVQIG